MLIFLEKNLLNLNLFSNLFLRSLFSLLTSFFIVFFFGKNAIFFLKKLKIKQVIRKTGPKTHFKKNSIPTMGGILILFSIIVSLFLWIKLNNFYFWYVIFTLIGYGIIGFFDDYYKVIDKNPDGLNAKWKYIWESLLALLISIFLYSVEKNSIIINFFIPFLKIFGFKISIFYIMLTYFVIVGTSNAVNLTDGLDGLVIVPIIFVLFVFSFVAYFESNLSFANYINIPYIYKSSELVVICFTIIGSVLGFLWFNSYPAQILMGDVGSLSLGGAIGVISILLRQELLLLIIGGIFIFETLSVILQVLFFKIFRKRVFKMAPIHHHYEIKGIPEPKITIRFWIISLILTLIGVIILRVF